MQWFGSTQPSLFAFVISLGVDLQFCRSVKALKALLAEKRIPCTDCVEKADLIQRLREKTKPVRRVSGTHGPGSGRGRRRLCRLIERAPLPL